MAAVVLLDAQPMYVRLSNIPHHTSVWFFSILVRVWDS